MFKIINSYNGRVYGSVKTRQAAKAFMAKHALIKVDDSNGKRGRAIFVYSTKTIY